MVYGQDSNFGKAGNLESVSYGEARAGQGSNPTPSVNRRCTNPVQKSKSSKKPSQKPSKVLASDRDGSESSSLREHSRGVSLGHEPHRDQGYLL